MRKPEKTVIWPANVDSSKSRRMGRKLLKHLSVDQPTSAEIEDAARKLNLNPTLVPDAARPRTWWEKTGYIVVSKSGRAKRSILKDVAETVANTRNSSAKGKRF